MKVLRPSAEGRADDLERGRDELLRRLRGLPASSAERITIVFDGQSGLGRGTREAWGGGAALFARGEGGADALILELLAAERDRSRCTVVSSDRELAAEARRLGARVISSHDYMRQLESRRDGARQTKSSRAAQGRRSATGDKPAPPGRAEVERWEDEFSKRDRSDED